MRAPTGKVIVKQDPYQQSRLIIHNDLEPLRDVVSGVIVSKGEDVPKGIKTSCRSLCELTVGSRVAYRSLTIEKNGKLVNRNEFKLDNQVYVSVDFEDILGIYN